MNIYSWVCIICAGLCLLSVVGVYIALGAFGNLCRDMAALCDKKGDE